VKCAEGHPIAVAEVGGELVDLICPVISMAIHSVSLGTSSNKSASVSSLFCFSQLLFDFKLSYGEVNVSGRWSL